MDKLGEEPGKKMRKPHLLKKKKKKKYESTSRLRAISKKKGIYLISHN